MRCACGVWTDACETHQLILAADDALAALRTERDALAARVAALEGAGAVRGEPDDRRLIVTYRGASRAYAEGETPTAGTSIRWRELVDEALDITEEAIDAH